jgi:hypothetical protein
MKYEKQVLRQHLLHQYITSAHKLLKGRNLAQNPLPILEIESLSLLLDTMCFRARRDETRTIGG